MSKLLLTFTMSLDGFIAGPEIGVEQPMGRGGERLHHWMFNDSADRGIDPDMAKKMLSVAGAVILGRRTFDVGLKPWGDTPYPMPCFVLTHQRRESLAMKSGIFTFVSDGIASALRQAKAAAGGKDIVVMGANAAQQYLKAGLADEIVLQLAPVLLGAGTRLFDSIGDEQIELTRTRMIGSPFVTHLKFSVAKRAGTSAG
jgi:dihydrofolate reductase